MVLFDFPSVFGRTMRSVLGLLCAIKIKVPHTRHRAPMLILDTAHVGYVPCGCRPGAPFPKSTKKKKTKERKRAEQTRDKNKKGGRERRKGKEKEAPGNANLNGTGTAGRLLILILWRRPVPVVWEFVLLANCEIAHCACSLQFEFTA